MKYWILSYKNLPILIAVTINTIVLLDVHQPLTADELRILKIVLAEHVDKLNENGVSLDLALSGGLVLSKQKVVECLSLIGQVSISKVLNNKQGNKILLDY
jgi:hypothetical protein